MHSSILKFAFFASILFFILLIIFIVFYVNRIDKNKNEKKDQKPVKNNFCPDVIKIRREEKREEKRESLKPMKGVDKASIGIYIFTLISYLYLYFFTW